MNEDLQSPVERGLEACEAALGGMPDWLAAIRKVYYLREELEAFSPEAVNTIANLADILDGVPDAEVGRLWNKEALKKEWDSRDAYLESCQPDLTTRFQRLQADLLMVERNGS